MAVFEKRSRIAAPPEVVFAFHARPDALALLMPPGERARVLEREGGLGVGARTVIEMRVGPVPWRMVYEHTAYEEGRMFRDEMQKGPFARWVHTHRVEPDGDGGAWLSDHVDYALPLGGLGALVAGGMVRRRIARIFEHRHEVTRRVCEGRP